MTNRHVVIGAAILLTAFGFTTVGRADTISYADAVTMLANDCGSDIKKYCKGLNLGGGRIQTCLEQHTGKVSPTCTVTLANVIRSIGQRQAAQSSFATICKHDIAQYCKSVKGEGNVLSCLNKATRVNEGQCGQAIIDAGWR
ncbi:cysteine rich repeat-containing protein [Sinorhizobium sp. NFACC03]|uniref:cysteine rich repeat-containing protein n=1 Tax=Sinorhizobium sp. NFACC03 TaxID=1566295 RepID=UPI000B86434D|nr:cysteine rich repeat-containing protein [Sinorhizobium sp. NFACC03]